MPGSRRRCCWPSSLRLRTPKGPSKCRNCSVYLVAWVDPSQESCVFAKARVEAQPQSLGITGGSGARQHRVVIEGGKFAQNHGICFSDVGVDPERGLNTHAEAWEYRGEERLRMRRLLTI